MKKYDFVMVVTVDNCNPNGDPLNEGRPRTNIAGYGEMSAECIKRKSRNRMQDYGCKIFVQSDERREDEYTCLRDRANGNPALEKAFKAKDNALAAEIACAEWADVRLFGQLFAYGGGTSVGIKGAVSVCHAQTVEPVEIKDIQIVKSTNGEPPKKGGTGKSSDTMGCKTVVEHGVYVVKGSVNPMIAEKNGVTEEDIDVFKKALVTLFENDESAARPAGSMDVAQVYWFEQDGKNYKPTAKIFKLVTVDKDGSSTVAELPDGVKLEELV